MQFKNAYNAPHRKMYRSAPFIFRQIVVDHLTYRGSNRGFPSLSTKTVIPPMFVQCAIKYCTPVSVSTIILVPSISPSFSINSNLFFMSVSPLLNTSLTIFFIYNIIYLQYMQEQSRQESCRDRNCLRDTPLLASCFYFDFTAPARSRSAGR